jgi:hypothetical protein
MMAASWWPLQQHRLSTVYVLRLTVYRLLLKPKHGLAFENDGKEPLPRPHKPVL